MSRSLVPANMSALEEIDDGVWNVYFGPLKLGRLLERHMRIEDAFGRLSDTMCNLCLRTCNSSPRPLSGLDACYTRKRVVNLGQQP